MSAAALVLVLFLFAAFLAAARKGLFTQGRRAQNDHWPVFPKKVLTPVEQQCYQRPPDPSRCPIPATLTPTGRSA